jgi:hypothetical protein
MNTYQTTTAPKKIIALLLALCMALALLPGMEMQVAAAEVPGVQAYGLVLDSGVLKINGEAAVENTHYTGSYDYTGGVLTLDDFSFTTSAATALQIPSGITGGLTIALVDENSIMSTNNGTSASSVALRTSSMLTISGNGSLTATGGAGNTQSHGIYVDNATLTINGNATVTATSGATGTSRGITINNDLYQIVVADNATVTATGASGANFSYGIYGNLDIDGGTVKLASGAANNESKPWSGTTFTVPAGGYRYTADNGAHWTGISDSDFAETATASDIVSTNLWVAPLEVQTQYLRLYNDELWLLRGATATAVAQPGVDYTGSYSYDTVHNILTLTNFHFTASAQNVLSTRDTPSLTIVLEGENRLISKLSSGTNSYALNVEGGTIIRGDGTLTATAGNPASGGSYGINVANGTLTVSDNVTINATGGAGTNDSYGIYGSLTITGGTVTTSGNTQAVSGTVTPPDLTLTTTKPYTWWKSDTTTHPGGIGTNTTVTEYSDSGNPKFIKIACTPGAQTRSLNLNTSSGKLMVGTGESATEAMPGVNYTGDYDYTGGVLTLDDFSFSTSAEVALRLTSAVTIALVGENSLVSNGSSRAIGLQTDAQLTITGSGTLNATSGATSGDASYGLYSSALEITGGATVNATGGNVSGNGNSIGIFASSETVTVSDGATLIATGGGVSSSAYSRGITGNLTINGGTVTASGNTAAVSGDVTPIAPYIWWVNNTTTDNSGSGGTKSTTAFNTGTNAISSPQFIKIAPTTLSNVATLYALTVTAGEDELIQDFAASTTEYTASVDNDVTSVTVAATSTDVNAQSVVVTSDKDDDVESNVVDLVVGANVLTITVTAEDGTTTGVYTVTITRAASADATLSGLTISAGTLSPTFIANTTSYTASVGNDVTSVTVTATANATARGVVVASYNDNDVESNVVDLVVGANVLTITVTAEDGTTTGVYTVTITRAAAIIAAGTVTITAPVAGATPSSAVNHSITGVSASVAWSGSPTTFAANTPYTATVTLTAASGYVFPNVGSEPSDFAFYTVNGNTPTFVSNDGSTLVFTYTFGRTGKYTGATIATAPTESDKSDTMITVNAAELSDETGQTILYAINQSSTVEPTGGWGASTTFEGLTSNTIYYVWAKAQANTDYAEGMARVSAAITTKTAITAGAVTITAPVVGAAPSSTVTHSITGVVTGGAVSWSPSPSTTFEANTEYTATVTLTAASNYVFPNVGSEPDDLTTYATGAVFVSNNGTVLVFDVAYRTGKYTGSAIATAPTELSKTDTTISVNAATLSVPTTVQTILYAINQDGTTAPTGGWGASTTFEGLTSNTIYYVWAKAQANTDYAEGVASPSVAITTNKTDASLSLATATYDKKDGEAIVVTLTPGDYTLSAIKNGDDILTLNTDYTESSHVYTIATSYLNTLATGTNTLTFDMNEGNDLTVTITVSDTRPTVSTVTVTPATPTVKKGGTLGFSAVVTGNYNPAQTVNWSVSPTTGGSSIDRTSGILTVAEGETASELTVTATSTVDPSISGTATVTVVLNDAQSVAAAVAALDWDDIKGSNTSQSAVTTDLNLSTRGANGTSIAWSSNYAAIDSLTGVVTRPSHTAGDRTVTLTAGISKGTARDTVIFNLTVAALPATDTELVSEAKAAVTWDTIKNGNTDANAVTSALTLPTTGANDTTISWESNDTVTIGTSGVVTRPPYAAGNKTVTLTATISKNSVSDTKVFTLTVTRIPASTDADLATLTISEGTLSPGFDAGTYSYSASVANSVESVDISATANDENASVSGTGNNKLLRVGANTFTITVTAQNGTTTKAYTVTITRAASADATLSDLSISAGTLSPAFASGTLGYSASVGNDVTSVNIVATKNHANATVSGDTGTQELVVGANPFTITVTAQDGTTTKAYTVTITRAASADATLSGLTISAGTLTPSFTPSTLGYSASVSNAVTSVNIVATKNHANATVSGDTGTQELVVGANPFTITVTAQDGTTTKAYTVTIIRAASADATLSTLTVSAGVVELIQDFTPGTLGYSASVGSDVDEVTIAAMATHANATVTGDTGAQDNLIEGYNEFTITVTAEDDATTLTYTIGITCALTDATSVSQAKTALDLAAILNGNTDANAVIANLSLPTTGENGTEISWGSNNTAIATDGTVTRPLYADGNAIVRLTATISKGTASDTVIFNLTVTAQDASTDATLSGLSISESTLTPGFAPGTLGYSASVGNDVTSVTISATASDTNASVSGVGEKSLDVGDNTFTITVTAQDGTTNIYTIDITRAEAVVEPPVDPPVIDPPVVDPPIVDPPVVEPVAPTVTPTALNLTAGESGTLHITLGTSYTGATISSSDSAFATVSPASLGAEGDVQVNGVAAGNVVITIMFTGGTSGYSTAVPVIVSAAQVPPDVDPPVIDPPIVDPPVIDPPVVDPPVVDPPDNSGGGSSGGGSSGGGSSGGGSTPTGNATPANTPTPVTTQQAAKSAQEAVKAAVAEGADSANIKLKNSSEIGRAALQAIAGAANSLPGGAAVLADSLAPDSSAVEVRIKLDVIEAIEDLKSGVIKVLNLAASTTNSDAKQVQTIFDTFFGNDKQAVHFEMEGIWGQPVQIAVKLNPEMDSNTLYFYTYDKKTNRYTRLPRPNYWVDRNGYVHFTTEIADDIIISEGELDKK